MRGSAFCYHHGRRIPPARKNCSSEPRIEIPATLDQDGISQALGNVLQGLVDGRMSARRASVLLWGLRTVADRPNSSLPPAGSDTLVLPDQLFDLIDDSDQETIALVNTLAAKLGLDSPDAH